MNRKRQTHIESLATKLLAEANCWDPNFSIYEVVKHCKAEWHRYDFGEEVLGTSFEVNGRKIIGTHEKLNKHEARFLVAHSLGHITLGHIRNPFVETRRNLYTIINPDHGYEAGAWMQEREANAFAAALLMPEPLIDTMLVRAKGKLEMVTGEVDIIKDLAKDFGVSYQQMALRLSTLKWIW